MSAAGGTFERNGMTCRLAVEAVATDSRVVALGAATPADIASAMATMSDDDRLLLGNLLIDGLGDASWGAWTTLSRLLAEATTEAKAFKAEAAHMATRAARLSREVSQLLRYRFLANELAGATTDHGDCAGCNALVKEIYALSAPPVDSLKALAREEFERLAEKVSPAPTGLLAGSPHKLRKPSDG